MNETKKPARILVVDDEERNRKLLATMLEAEGYSASEAADGAQALEFVRQSPPDLILLDIMMPGMDGYEVARALKADSATKAIPVVMVTALDDRASRLRGLEAGAEEFVTKPVDRNELRIRVRNLLRLREFSDHLEQLVEEKTAKLEAEIVERKRIQNEQARLVAIIEATPDFVATGHLDGPVLYVNPAGLRMIGYEPGQDLSVLRGGAGHPDWVLKLLRETGVPHAIEHGTWSGETAFLQRDGREIPISQVIIAHKGASGSVECLSTIARDITERKRTEDQLRTEKDQQQALLTKLQQTQSHLVQVEKMAAIGLLAAGVAHEINNPASYIYSNLVRMNEYCRNLVRLLAAYRELEATLPAGMGMGMGRVSGELEAVKQQVDPARVEADLLSMVSESLQGIERIIGIVSDLKEFSHVDSKESWQPADINKTLDTTANVVWNKLKYKAEVRKEYGALPPVTCLVFQLNQVFMNLLVNAAQAIEGRGIITIRTGAAGQEVWVEVADTGAGIPKEHLDRIFEPFFTTKPVGTGTGLGLWVSLGVVQKHRGRIEVVSEVGKGTAFKVWLPINAAPGA